MYLDLEDVLTLQTKLYRCAHIVLGKCLPPVTSRRNPLLRTAYGISPDRNLRDRQVNLRDRLVNLRDRQVNLRDRQVNLRDRQVNIRDKQVNLRDRQVSLRDKQVNL